MWTGYDSPSVACRRPACLEPLRSCLLKCYVQEMLRAWIFIKLSFRSHKLLGYGPSLWFLGHRPLIYTCLVCFSALICLKRIWGMIFMILSSVWGSRTLCILLLTVVWNDYLLIFWPNVIFYFTRSWKPNANNQICWITKVSTHSKTLIQFCWKFIYFKVVYWWFLKIWICDKMRALFIFQIIDYAWISIMLFDLCWNW